MFPFQSPRNAYGYALREANSQSYKIKTKNNPLKINFSILKYSQLICIGKARGLQEGAHTITESTREGRWAGDTQAECQRRNKRIFAIYPQIEDMQRKCVSEEVEPEVEQFTTEEAETMQMQCNHKGQDPIWKAARTVTKPSVLAKMLYTK